MLLYEWYIKNQWILKTDLFFKMGLISLKGFYTVNWYTYIVQKCLYYIRILQRMRVRRLNNVVKNYLYISQKIDWSY